MTRIMTQNGKILTKDGKITTDMNCCCDDNCPVCCAKLIGGALIDGKYRFFVEDGTHSLEVLVTLPGGTDTICDNESMLVEMIFTGPEPIVSPGAFCNFDPSWIVITTNPTPSEANDDAGGYVLWEGNTSLEYDVSLQYTSCFQGAQPTWGRVRVGGYGLEVDIEFRQCPGDPCCEVCPPCPQCCYRLSSTDGCIDEWSYDEDGDFFFQAFEIGPYYVVFEAELQSDSVDPGVVCGDIMAVLRIKIGSRDPGALATLVIDEVRVDFPGWTFDGASPPPDNNATAAADFVATWFDATALLYTTNLSLLCSSDGVPTISMSVKIGTETVGANLTFSQCATDANCNCCCDHCCDDCHFPVITDPLCLDFDIPLIDIEGTRIENLITTVSATNPVFCGGTEFDVTYEQSGLATHVTTCTNKCGSDTSTRCRVSACYFIVPVIESCAGSTVFALEIFYIGGGVWSIAAGGVGYIYWVTGRTSYSGDCETATASGTFALGGTVYTWTTTFDVVRSGDPDTYTECPLPDTGEI